MTKDIIPCCDKERRTCIQVERSKDDVKYIPLDVAEGLVVRKMSTPEFDRRYKPMVGYPPERACQLYVGYSRTIGASKEALEYLGRITEVSNQESDMATKKRAAKKSESLVNKSKPSAKSTKALKAASKALPSVEKPTRKSKIQSGEKKPTAAQMFQDLIMQGKLTDDQIFEQVKSEFGLDDKKRGYVSWYRNYLKKHGKNPPQPKA